MVEKLSCKVAGFLSNIDIPISKLYQTSINQINQIKLGICQQKIE